MQGTSVRHLTLRAVSGLFQSFSFLLEISDMVTIRSSPSPINFTLNFFTEKEKELVVWLQSLTHFLAIHHFIKCSHISEAFLRPLVGKQFKGSLENFTAFPLLSEFDINLVNKLS